MIPEEICSTIPLSYQALGKFNSLLEFLGHHGKYTHECIELIIFADLAKRIVKRLQLTNTRNELEKKGLTLTPKACLLMPQKIPGKGKQADFG